MIRSFIILILLVLVISCNPKGDRDKLFTLLSPSVTGVNFVNQLTETEEMNMIEYLYFNNGGGVAAGDMNNDGLIDLYFTSNQGTNKLFLNKGNLRFEDITGAAGVAGTGNWKTGVNMADVNADGLLDIYICQVGRYKSLSGKNQLFINMGNLTFQDMANEYGLDFQGFSTQAAFFDYDMDGDLDMYLLNHSVHSSRSYGDASLRYEKDSISGDRLFRNDEVNGKRVFTDVTKEAGIYSSQIGYGLGINVSDINNDGYPDIYISNDFHENDYLYINNGNETFSEKLTESMEHTSRSSMGNDVGDINNDGLLDVIVLDMLPEDEKTRKQSGGEDDMELFGLKLKFGYHDQFVRNTLQLNLGGGHFSEIGRLAGVSATDWSWSPLFCDVDNDGWKDLFITNGIFRRANDLDYVKFLTGGNRYNPSRDNRKASDKELYEKMPLNPNTSYLYKNNRDLSFSNKASEWGITKKSFSNGSTYADLDNDGDLDLIVNNINEQAFIYRNNSETNPSNHYLSISLKGNNLNPKGIGTRVTIYSGGQKQISEQFPVRGFQSSTSEVLHFGLDSIKVADSLLVHWPDQSKQIIRNIEGNKLIVLNIKDATRNFPASENPSDKEKLFAQVQIDGLQFRHQEDGYSDFQRERLIPHSLSQDGPALAVGDVNGDGLEDFFVGGAARQSAMLFIQQKQGTFKPTMFPDDLFTDDVDAAFFDADGDGDLDMYVVHGGNELTVGDPLLSDKLWINDGKGIFKEAKPGALPFAANNGSCIRPCDFDGDGDIDLFVGTRSVPGAYGWSPNQVLLENDGKGHFDDVTDSGTKELKTIGMVTDACWMDYDKDGDQDLTVTGEWMNVSIFRNDRGIFSNVTAKAGLGETSGWWNCIRASDIDDDGDIDLIAGNLGLNSLLKASPQEPVEMYLNDFDNNGSPDQVICSWQNGTSFPVASLDEMVSQIPDLINKYPNYSDFAGQTVVDLFGTEKIGKSIVKKAVLFESCLFVNNGDGTFNTKKLPVTVQFSPVRDILTGDFNSDGNPDLILVGNNYLVRPSLGRQDASFGWFLPGDKGYEFNTPTPVQSGFKVKGDSRKILSIKISGKQHLIVGVNNNDLQIFRCLK
ncbi:MAG: hypothetical protein C0397_01795 [Odoribacter sp.]|nr:hypothetical protein [Odoribacter sp.]